MENAKILFISQEITPYLPETEMSILSRNLPQGIQEKGREIRTFMPRYGCINERRNQLHEVIRLSGMNMVINDSDHPLIIKVASIQSARMQVYFIDNEDYFQRKQMLKDDKENFFEDNDERAIFFAKGVLETVKKLRWTPDIIHCHGWFTSFIPIYIKKVYQDDPTFLNAKIITSVYDSEFDKPFSKDVRTKLNFDGVNNKDLELFKITDYPNLIKLSINFSDAVIEGSKTINSKVAEFIEKSNKPTLSFIETDYIDKYDQFYDQILKS